MLRRQQVDSLPDIFSSLPPLPSSLVKPWWCSKASASGIFQPSYSLGWVCLSWPPSPGLSETDFLSFALPQQWPPQHGTQSKPCFSRSHRTLLCKAAHPCLHPHRHFSLGPQSEAMGRGLGESGPGIREPGRGTDGPKLSGAGRERRVHITAGTRHPYTVLLQHTPLNVLEENRDQMEKVKSQNHMRGSQARETGPAFKSPCMHTKSLQSCPILCNAMDCNPLGSSVHGIPQARILEWAAMPSSRGSS